MAEKKEESKGEVIQLVNFRLRNEDLGVEIDLVREITRVEHITPIPEAPSFIRGVTNLRGQIIAVVDLAKQFGFTPREKLPEKARIVVVEIKDQTVGMLVDEVPAVLRMPEENLEPTPELIRTGVGKEYIKGVGKLEDRLIILLDLDKVLTPREAKELTEAGGTRAK